MTSRELEASLITRCTVVARENPPAAQDQREANVFKMAAVVIRSRFPREATKLMRASELYFTTHPNERLASCEVVRRRWIMNLPRLRNLLGQRLNEN